MFNRKYSLLIKTTNANGKSTWLKWDKEFDTEAAAIKYFNEWQADYPTVNMECIVLWH